MAERYDLVLVYLWLLLVLVGSVFVVSSTQHLPSSFLDSHQFRQLIYVLIAMLGFFFVARVTPLALYYKLHREALFLAFVLASLVLLPFIGVVAGGSRRWIDLGVVTFQVTEGARILLVVYIAGYLARVQDSIRQGFWVVIRPLVWISAVLALVLLQPDFGTVAVVGTLIVLLLFVAGVNKWIFASIALLGSAGLAALIAISPYRVARVSSFLDPWANPLGSGYQLSQSLIAIGRGEFTGVGLGDGVQKIHYLPEAHNDFVFAVIVEEIGFFGASGVLLLLVFLVIRCLKIGRNAIEQQHLFGGYLAYATGLLIALQSLVNVGVTIGVLPTKGITLPFVSYGGNSLIVCSILVGLVCRVHYETESRRQPEELAVVR